MSARKRSYLGTLIVLFLCLTPTDASPNAQAQQGSKVTCAIKWQADTSICPDPRVCNIVSPKQDDAGNVYIYSRSTKRLLILAPNGYRLSQQVDLPTFIDFIPIRDYLVLHSIDHLYKYSFERNTVQPVSSLSTSLAVCYPIAVRSFASLWLVGTTGKFLACHVTKADETGNVTYGLDLVDVQSEHMTTFAELHTHLGMKPWRTIIAGQDGLIYMQRSFVGYPSSMPNDLLTDDDLNENHNHIVLKYVPQSSIWSVIRIPQTVIQELGELVFINEESSMYFVTDSFNSTPLSANKPYHMTKVDGSGNLLWSVVVPDFITGISVIGITPTEQLLVWQWYTTPPQVNQCQIDPTSFSTTANHQS